MLLYCKQAITLILMATLVGDSLQAKEWMELAPPPESNLKIQGTSSFKPPADPNNPLAATKSISVHNIYTTSLYDVDGTANLTWIRYAQPIGRFLLRASLPVSTINLKNQVTLVSPRITQDVTETGLGDFNLFVTYIATQPTSELQFGLGPLLSAPTATEDALGSGKWSAGVAIVAYYVHSIQFQAGLLATWQHSFAGNTKRRKLHIASLQPMLMWQLGRGLYLRSTAISMLDFANNNYLVPMGLGIGKVVTSKKLTFNLFAEPQYTVWHHGPDVPKAQLFIGINTQF